MSLSVIMYTYIFYPFVQSNICLMKRVLLIIICFSVFLFGKTELTAQNYGLPDFTSVSEKNVHSVVSIQCKNTRKSLFYDDFFSFFMPLETTPEVYETYGSGVIISSDGYIITNNHVVQDADVIEVVLNDKRSFVAKLVGNDPSCDLAVVKIEAEDLGAVHYGNSDDVLIGEWVLAIGNPFNLTSTVTAGIVSAKARNLNILGAKMSDTPIKSFIQTDAAVNPGNSGGALVNLKGELIGINTAIATSTGAYAGYSFAIPSNIVRKVTSDLINYGITQRAYLSVHFAEMDSKLAERKGLNSVKGVYVAKTIKDGAAYKAGIKAGDIITKVDSKTVNSNPELNEILLQHSPGDVVNIEVERDGDVKSFEVMLVNAKGNTDIIKKKIGDVADVLGGSFRELNEEEKHLYGIANGVVVDKVGTSPFARLGIRNGFVITSIDKKDSISMSDLMALENKKGKIIIEGFYPNDGRTYYFVLVL